MAIKLTYAIHYVADMERALAFYRDTLGLPIKFESPEWSEFATGETTLALHLASAQSPAGSTQLGFGTDDVAAAHAALTAKRVRFTRQPTPEHGITLAAFVDSEGAECSLSG